MPLMARQAPAPMPWLASWKRYIFSQTPITSCASIPSDQLPQGRLDQLRDRRVRAAVVRLAPADDALVGRDLDDDGVALDRGADAERDAVGRGDGKGVGIGLDVA